MAIVGCLDIEGGESTLESLPLVTNPAFISDTANFKYSDGGQSGGKWSKRLAADDDDDE